MEEEFRPVAINPNYQVSNFGRILNIKTNVFLNPYLSGKNNKYRRIDLGKHQQYYIHRLVAIAFIDNPNNCPCVDHINTDTFNNHVSNLRWCSIAENNRNKSMNKNNTSGYKGVTFSKRANKWVATCSVNGKLKAIGLYANILDAVAARLQAVNETYRDFTHHTERLVCV